MKTVDFVKYQPPRLRHHAFPGLYLPFKDIRADKIVYPRVFETLDWSEVFANGKAPGYLDIGPGMGKLMIETALNESSVNVLGLEIRRNAVKWVNKVIEGEKIPNAKSIWYNVVNGLQFIKDKSIKKIFYLFPDPWIKKRHNKRRAFTKFLLDEITRILRDDGKLYLMTDVKEVEEYQTAVIKEHGRLHAHIIEDGLWDLPFITNHEIFCLKKKIPYIKMICSKNR